MADESLGATGDERERPEIGRPTLEFVPAPRTALTASVHIFLRDRCLSLTDDEVWLLQRFGLLRFLPGDPSEGEFEAATRMVEDFRRSHTDFPSLFRIAAAHWFHDHSDCFNCPPQMVMHYGLEERFQREHPEIELETRRRAAEHERLARKRCSVYPSFIALYEAAEAHEAHEDHDLDGCPDDFCPSLLVSRLHLLPAYTAWRSTRPPPVDRRSKE